jgi:hypothetical protein
MTITTHKKRNRETSLLHFFFCFSRLFLSLSACLPPDSSGEVGFILLLLLLLLLLFVVSK